MAEAVGVILPVEDGLPAAEYVELAQLAERSGYDAVLAGEVAGPEVFSLLGMIAARTSSIRIGSGIVGCYARPPALTAMGFATLASCAPGRVIAGLGASSPIIVEGWYGRSFGQPVATVREFVAVLGQALSGNRVSFAGRALRSDGFRATMPPPSPVPVLLAAMKPWNGCGVWCCSTPWCRRTAPRSAARSPRWTRRPRPGSAGTGARRCGWSATTPCTRCAR